MDYKRYCQYTAEEKQNELNAVKKLEKLLPKYNIHLQFGSLLASIRQQSLIDGDYDMDVCYLSEYHTAKEVEQEMIDLYNFFRRNKILAKYFIRDKTNEGHYIGITDIDKKIIRPFGQAHIVIDSVVIDFFTSWVDEKGDYYTCQWGNFGNAEQYFPLTTGKIYDVEFKIPKNAEKILERLYGDWKTPAGDHPSKRIERASYLGRWLNE